MPPAPSPTQSYDRYFEHYKITEEELDWLEEHVVILRELVETACEGHLEELTPTL